MVWLDELKVREMELDEHCWLEPQLNIGGFRIATVIRQKVHCTQGNNGLGVFGSKRPIAVVIASGSDRKVIGLESDALQFIDANRMAAKINAFVVQGES